MELVSPQVSDRNYKSNKFKRVSRRGVLLAGISFLTQWMQTAGTMTDVHGNKWWAFINHTVAG